ncbi:M23 family metallopeptidase [Aquamicrobium zhengzhouense]|uniref:M23 family metallopeptidase n=1 Tax=Aquamicrobium zhengzhouense TaxID=2781738 RepID=A0ABS0SDN4_9HYPH|nr:M23 family metallopeptidase [Aquamicrobium zhengzhouense]MBI1620582.1 M23 family metallopeptidase [Aquamicrobium zhengzhouense]
MARNRQASVFGRRKEPHTIIIARGDEIRHFIVRPWLAAFCGTLVVVAAIGYLLGTTYLVLRDDIIGAAAARQARIQQAYEDRISMLRGQVDRITSRQLLDQQLVVNKVSQLLARQNQLSERHGQITPILERAREVGAAQDSAPVPSKRPELRAARSEPVFAAAPALSWPGETVAQTETEADGADRLFVSINRSLRAIEEEQLEGLDKLAETAFQTADQIAEALASAGLSADITKDETASGGPLMPLDGSTLFDTRVRELDEALAKLESAKAVALQLPIHNPAPGKAVTSSFGVRRDPFVRRQAMHTGIDFRTPTGTPIHSTGAGKVVKAGWNGGYGRMVEIEHGHGLSTRYAHLSRIDVSVGQKVSTGDLVGKAGSTGRSTGPHLHYEIRRNGTAIDPVRFLKAGRKIQNLL